MYTDAMNKSAVMTFVGIAAVAGLVLGILALGSVRTVRQSVQDLATRGDQEAATVNELRSQLAMVSGRAQGWADEQRQQLWALRQELSNVVARLAAPAPSPSSREATGRTAEKPAVPATVVPEGKGTYHTIRQGDILSRLARQYGTTPEAIEKLNPGLDPTKLQIGQKIRVK